MSRKDIENFIDDLSNEDHASAQEHFKAAVQDRIADKIAKKAKDITSKDNEE